LDTVKPLSTADPLTTADSISTADSLTTADPITTTDPLQFPQQLFLVYFYGFPHFPNISALYLPTHVNMNNFTKLKVKL